jgi:hypothetical protein
MLPRGNTSLDASASPPAKSLRSGRAMAFHEARLRAFCRGAALRPGVDAGLGGAYTVLSSMQRLSAVFTRLLQRQQETMPERIGAIEPETHGRAHHWTAWAALIKMDKRALLSAADSKYLVERSPCLSALFAPRAIQ